MAFRCARRLTQKQSRLAVVTSVVCENDGITVRQAVAHTTTMAAMWFTPFEEKGTIIRSVSKSNYHNSVAGSYDTTTTAPVKSVLYS